MVYTYLSNLSPNHNSQAGVFYAPNYAATQLHVAPSRPSPQGPEPLILKWYARGQMLIFLSTALILIALLYLLYFSIHNLQTPGPVPFSDWLSIGLASSHLFTSALIIKLAKEGKTKAGSALWLGWYALTITGVALPRMEVSFHEMTARLLTPIVAAGPLLGAWWSIITAVVVSIFETGIAFVMVPALEPDSLMGGIHAKLADQLYDVAVQQSARTGIV
jgi:hypothetical protein